MPAAAAVERWPLVGRWGELEIFEQALASDGTAGVVVFGPAGVGKTRLADEFRRHCADTGRSTVRAVASRTAAAAPLGALAHLLPAEVANAADAPSLFAHAAERFAQTQPVVVVDDLHLLDVTSLTLLCQLVANSLVFLVGTVRTDDPLPDGVHALVNTDRVVRVDLAPLDRADVDTLLHLTLGGPVDGTTAAALWNASLGNVFVLRELVVGARTGGTLTDTEGVWHLEAPPASSGRLATLVEERLSGVDPRGRAVMQLIALCGAIGVDDVEQLAPLDVLSTLERDGHLVLVESERRRTLELAHPLFGEHIRETVGDLEARRLLVAQAGRVRAHGARRREDPLLLATWELAAGVPVDPTLLLSGARLARYAHDFANTERLARAAYREDPRPEVAALLGEALYELGRFDDAEAVLAPADDACEAAGDGTDLACEIATIRSTNFEWGIRRADDALRVRRRARARAESDSARGLLLAGEAAVLAFSGRPHDALALLDANPPVDDPRAVAARAIASSPTLTMVGRTSEALEVARHGFDVHVGLRDAIAIANPGAHVVAQVLALCEHGALADALALAEFVHEVAINGGVPLPRMWATLNLGRVTLCMGRPATARRWFMESAAIAGTTGFVPIRRLALSGLAVSASLLGERDAAAAAAAEIAPTENDPTFFAPELWLGGAWAAVAANDPARGRDLLATGAREARLTGHHTSEAWLLHDIARLGAPETVVARLSELAGVCDGALVQTRARHAQALAAHDAGALSSVSDAFADIGARLCAAEAAAAAVDAFRRDGDQRRATAMQERAAALAAQCEGAQTIGLLAADTVVPLTRREREIALLAADGIPSKQIGERLFLSARTVNNHLQRVYTKLGVSSRTELRDALQQRGEAS